VQQTPRQIRFPCRNGVMERRFLLVLVLLAASCGISACAGSPSHSGAGNTQAKPATSSTTSVASTDSPTTAASWTVAPTQSVDGNEVVIGTSCLSKSFCVAVGTGPQLGWDGSRWAPLPGSDSATTADDTSLSNLSSVSCVSQDFCMAVGFSGVGPAPLARVWNGKTWKDASPPSASSRYMLNGVSCVSADDCWAVGLSGTFSTGAKPIAVHWNESSWEAAAVPSQGDDQLAAVSCTSSRFCMAVGTSNVARDSTKKTPFTVVWNGSEWSVRQAAAFSSTGGIELHSVSCTSPMTCMAVGGDTLRVSSPPIAQWWDGNRWSTVSTAVGDGASSAYFASVSCSQPKSCMAVGTTGIGGSHGIAGTPLAEKWDGSAWSFVQTPSPDDGGLVGVSCTSPTWCVAAGGVFPNVHLLRWGP